jgi:hypothetical protein
MALYGLNLKAPKVVLDEKVQKLAIFAAYARKLKAEPKLRTSDKLYGGKK